MKWTESYKQILQETAETLKGSSRRRFMGQIVLELGYGGQSKAEKELGWNRGTVRKGISEVTSGVSQIDNFQARGRKRAEWHLPDLLSDLKKIVDCNSQTDPSFKSQRLYTRLSAKQVKEELISQCNYQEQELPTSETIRQKRTWAILEHHLLWSNFRLCSNCTQVCPNYDMEWKTSED